MADEVKMDDIPGSKMKPLTKVNEKGETVEDIRSVQLNEKISDTEYQILHPETDAYQVITDPERRFVSEAEKAKWNKAFELGASALHYRGKYDLGIRYYKYDVVYLEGNGSYATNEAVYPVTGQNTNGRRFFVYTSGAPEAVSGSGDGVLAIASNAPSYDQFIYNEWVNINFESYLAEFANNVRVTRDPTDAAYTFAICAAGTQNYRTLATTSSFFINPIKKTLEFKDASNNTTIKLDGSNGTVTANKFIGNLEGTADKAKLADEAAKYTTYQRDADKNLIGDHVKQGAEYIDDAITGLGKRIDAITDGTGGAVLSNKLVIQKNGDSLNGDGFDGSAAQTVNIRFTPQEITGLLDSTDKIQEKWLPDTLLGAMSYIGTFDASTGLMTTDLRDFLVDADGKPTAERRPFRKGDYAIAIVAGNLDPSGAAHGSEAPETQYFVIGDWAVYNGDLDGGNDIDAEEWTKVDNTDAVRTVNGQIGNVKTYKGAWVASTTYYQGDMVEYGNPAAIYVCIKDNSAAAFTEDNFKICGRIYAAADGIELTQKDNTFRHTFKEATSTVVGSESNPTLLTQQGIIAIDNVTRQDIYGHIKDVKTTYYKLPEDTWRPVEVNGIAFKGSAIDTGALNLTHDYRADPGSDRDPRVLVSAVGDKVVVSHKDTAIGKGSHTSEVLTTPVVTGQIKIGLGSQFTAPNFAWNASGHVDEYSASVFELPTDLIQHKHFNVKLTDGRSMIRSFTNDEFQDLADTDKARKFYDSDLVTNTFIAPSWTESMAFSGRLMANGFYQLIKDYKAGDASTLYRVIDESIKVYSGNKLNGDAIIGAYNTVNNRIELGHSGVHSNEGSVVYSAVAVNKYGITTAGAQILEFGTGEYVNEQWVSHDPSESLVIGGLFFRDIGPKRDNNGVV
jgi:hypothetical protein